MFEKYWFKPEHQPNQESPVEFELKPANMPTFHRLQIMVNRGGELAWEDCVAIFLEYVLGWKGLQQEYSQQAKRDLLKGEADVDLYRWIGEICGEIYSHALIKASERKNS